MTKRGLMPKTILVADDSPMVRKMLCKMFEAEQDSDLCAEAHNGKEAIALAKQCKPDLIILDLGMPEMTGVDAARELKRIMPDVPIILITMHGYTAKNLFEGTDSPFNLIVKKTNGVNIVHHVRSLIPV